MRACHIWTTVGTKIISLKLHITNLQESYRDMQAVRRSWVKGERQFPLCGWPAGTLSAGVKGEVDGICTAAKCCCAWHRRRHFRRRHLMSAGASCLPWFHQVYRECKIWRGMTIGSGACRNARQEKRMSAPQWISRILWLIVKAAGAIGFARRKDVKSGGTPVVEWGNGAAKTIEFCAFSKGNLLAPSMG